MEYFDLVLNILMWYVIIRIAFTLFDHWLYHRLDSKLQEIKQDLEAERLIPLTIELHENQYLCYNAKTNAFVCQGENLKEIVQKFKLRFPDRSVAIYNGDPEAVKFLKEQLKELS